MKHMLIKSLLAALALGVLAGCATTTTCVTAMRPPFQYERGSPRPAVAMWLSASSRVTGTVSSSRM